MRKILIFLFIFLGALLFSETLENITYRNGVFRTTFKENKKIIPTITYNNNQNIIELSYQNLKLKKDIPQNLNLNDKYLEKVSVTEIAGFTNVTFYLKEGIEYKVLNQNKETQVMFTEKKQPVVVIPSVPKKKYTIVIDPGHGGKDTGAIGNGYREKDIALAVSKKLAENLRDDFKVIMTRSTDVFIPLQERAEIANRNNSDFFISIHLNSGPNLTASGVEVFYYSKNPSAYATEVAKFENSVDKSVNTEYSDYLVNDIIYQINQRQSAAVGRDILNSIVNNFGLKNRGVLGANFAVLRGTHSAAVLVEIGFISNYADVSNYISETGQEKLVRGIADAIRKNFE